MDLAAFLRDVPDFPKPGILFYDISTLLAHPAAWKATVEQLKTVVDGYKPDVLAGIESRGFLVAAPLALELGLGFHMVRKKGKLPGKTIPYTYDLEYGSDTLEIHQDAFAPGSRVLMVDDLLATGGTARAAVELLGKLDVEVVTAAFVIELTALPGRKVLEPVPVLSLIGYDD